MRKLFIIALLFSLAFTGCEKEEPLAVEPEVEEELCWECITRIQENYYYCSGYTGPAQYNYVVKSEMFCGLTADQIETKEEVNTTSWTKVYDCNNTYPYSRIRYDRYMRCTLLE